MSFNLVWVAAIAVLSLVLTWLLRRYAIARSLMDIPNARSSHALPTPRGGGMAIVIGYLLALLVMLASGTGELAGVVALLGAGLGIAVLGFLDDHGHIAARWRLLGHFAAGIWGLYWLGGMPALHMFGFSLQLEWFGWVLGLLYLVWLLNLYNFMDGIDGLASVEAICVCLGACLIYVVTGQVQLVGAALLLAGAVAGFLCWNFPPAKIFMGDAGSGFLGITLGLLSIQAALANPALLWSWLILLGVFVVDATLTLLRRLLRGEKVYEAHRSHAYQFAARHFKAHRPVTLAVLAINLLWLLPWALAAGTGAVEGVLALLVAYAPLVVLASRFRAGQVESA
ncbi:MraY family glycosyltransferase [Pseudomonas sichuanensis]|uniref:MraY family glycosyltransferase n=1 Tax=Pseudomonas TaxID=286 RepID=UPI0036ED1F69